MVMIHRSDDFRFNIWRTQCFLCLNPGRNLQRYPWWIYEEGEDVGGEYPQCCCRVGSTSPVLSLNVLMCLSIKKNVLCIEINAKTFDDVRGLRSSLV